MQVAANMATILLDLALILALARVVGWVFARLGMPPVVGEILAGVILGPSIFGPAFSARLFPPAQVPYLSLLANIGLVLFMFVVGLELDISLVRGRGRVAFSVSIASIVLPFTLGIALATYLPASQNPQGEFWPFALFVGAAMSVTAFPVLARILTDRNMHHTSTGTLAMACAATDDVLAWTLLAVVIAISGGSPDVGGPGWLVALAVPFAIVAIVFIRPQLNRLTKAYEKAGRLTPSILAVVLVGLLLFAAITELLHVHFIFGAFLFGAIMPRVDATALRHEILVRLEQISVLLLLPVFFLVSGLKVDLRGLGSNALLQLALILAVAIGGKYFGAYVGARASGVPHWQSSALGILMNTRGLTELVILNVGLALNIISQELFTLLVVMAIVTTMMTGPLLRRAYPDKRIARDIAEAERAALGGAAATYRALVIADPGADNVNRLDVAISLVAHRQPAEVVVASLQPQQNRKLDVGSGLSDELAEITETMERLEALVRRGRDLGVPVRILAQLSADVATDLIARATALEPGFIVLGSGDVSAEAIEGAVECTVVVLDEQALSPRDAHAIAVSWDQGEASTSVLVACRMAASIGVPLDLTAASGASARRFSTVREQLTARGIDLSADGADHRFTVGTQDDDSADLQGAAGGGPHPDRLGERRSPGGPELRALTTAPPSASAVGVERQRPVPQPHPCPGRQRLLAVLRQPLPLRRISNSEERPVGGGVVGEDHVPVAQLQPRVDARDHVLGVAQLDPAIAAAADQVVRVGVAPQQVAGVELEHRAVVEDDHAEWRTRPVDQHRRLLHHVDPAHGAEEHPRVVEVVVLAEHAAHVRHRYLGHRQVLTVADDRERRRTVLDVRNGPRAEHDRLELHRGCFLDGWRLLHWWLGDGLAADRLGDGLLDGLGFDGRGDRFGDRSGHGWPVRSGDRSRWGRIHVGGLVHLHHGHRQLRAAHGPGSTRLEHEATCVDHAVAQVERPGDRDGGVVDPALDLSHRPAEQPLRPGKRVAATDLLAVHERRRRARGEHGHPGLDRRHREEGRRVAGHVGEQQREPTDELAPVTTVGGHHVDVVEQRGHVGPGGLGDEEHHPTTTREQPASRLRNAGSAFPLLG